MGLTGLSVSVWGGLVGPNGRGKQPHHKAQ